MLAEVAEDLLVAVGRRDHQNEAVVLRRRADHARAADVDLVDRVVPLHVETADRLLERVEIDADEVDRGDAVLLHRRDVLRIISQR